MLKKKTLPSNEYIESKKNSFKNLLQQVVSGEVNVNSNRETVADKLMIIKEELLLLKDKNIPYTALSKLLEDSLDLKISSQTLRSFCQNRLGFPKKSRKKASNTKQNKSTGNDESSSYNATKALSSNKSYD